MIGSRTADTADGVDTADSSGDGFGAVSTCFTRSAMMEIKLSERQLYLLIRIFL